MDLADNTDAIVVIDDAHHARSPLLAGLLAAVAAYARRCRFIVTSRVELDVAGAEGQAIAVGPMAERDLVELARLGRDERGDLSGDSCRTGESDDLLLEVDPDAPEL